MYIYLLFNWFIVVYMYYVTNIIGIHINIYPIDTRQYICKNGIVYLWMIENTLTNTCVTIYFCIEYLCEVTNVIYNIGLLICNWI